MWGLADIPGDRSRVTSQPEVISSQESGWGKCQIEATAVTVRNTVWEAMKRNETYEQCYEQLL